MKGLNTKSKKNRKSNFQGDLRGCGCFLCALSAKASPKGRSSFPQATAEDGDDSSLGTMNNGMRGNREI